MVSGEKEEKKRRRIKWEGNVEGLYTTRAFYWHAEESAFFNTSNT